MLRLLKSSFWSFVSILVRAVSNIAINKLFAIFYGPNGITLYAHFQNLLSIVTTVPDGGVNIGLVKFLAKGQPTSGVYKRYFWAGMLLNFLCILVALGLIFGFPGYYLEAFLREVTWSSGWRWGLYFSIGSMLVTLNLGLQAVVLARQQLKWHVFSSAVMSIGGVLVVYFTQGELPLNILLLWVLAAQAISFFLMLGVLYFKRLLPSLKSISIPKSVYRDLWKYILMALSAVVCLKLTNFYIRDFVIARFDLYQTGLWQAVVKVSENYSTVYSAVISMLVYPRLAAMVNEEDALRKFVRNTFYLVMPGLAAALLLVYLLRDWVLLLLFNEDFVVASYLFDYQLLGDFFRMWSVILTNLIVVRAHVKLYIGWQLSSALLYITLVSVLVKPFGLEGITIAHAVRYAATLAFAMLYYNKYIRP
ncbi:MATE family efflux transporter [Pontibacter cellulosilyticus]|uniref:O-antigen/teichoic acid export membrane protein n=1 Tax=Pontibacter cellulosilyticus TaxID=1720253 RepID=A0A923N6P5_9BACT|nr:hypothetical protein [Pontibacter cellulosilyticus]MBC5993213.1 hypothetical protein [Pontibacter cellulosilyticus]